MSEQGTDQMTDSTNTIPIVGVPPAVPRRSFTPEEIARGAHRDYIGGRWDTHGKAQFEYLLARGLQPEHRFLDVGAGCFRLGRYLVDYLKPGNYYAIDANVNLLQAGYDHEFTDEQRARVPIDNLRANERFNVDFGVEFDMAIAQSVFTHVSLNHVRLCLYRVARAMRPGGKFYVTFYEEPRTTRVDKLHPSGHRAFTERNPYWYYRSDIKWASDWVGTWDFRYIGDWNHPHHQMMVELTRLSETQLAQRRNRGTDTQRTREAELPRYRRVALRALRGAARRLEPH
jgi:SAM-dependent methyltransferase